MLISSRICTLGFGLWSVAVGAAAGGHYFQPIAVPPELGQGGTAYAISSDGSTVVGRLVYGTPSPRAFRWTPAGGVVALPIEPASGASEAWGVSLDGSTAVGYCRLSGSFRTPCRWSNGGFEMLRSPEGAVVYGDAWDGSSDGSVIVGRSGTPQNNQRAFRWTASTGVNALEIPLPPEDVYYSAARGVSADGSMICGEVVLSDDAGTLPFRWRAGTGMAFLPSVGFDRALAWACSPDGHVIAGAGFSDATRGGPALIWRGDDEPIVVPPLAPGHTMSPTDVSSDGRVIVGADITGSQHTGFVWDADRGLRSAQFVLEGECGLNLAGATITSVNSVTPDGRTIVGQAYLPGVGGVPFIAGIPEPSTLVLVLGLLTVLRTRS